MPLKDQGLVEPEEERHQWVFHVAVSGRYADLREAKASADEQQDVAQEDRSTEPQSVYLLDTSMDSFDLASGSSK
jgi:hypothetical protein